MNNLNPIYPLNFRSEIASEISKSGNSTAMELAPIIAFVNDRDAFNFLLAHFPKETRKVLGVEPYLELIKQEELL